MARIFILTNEYPGGWNPFSNKLKGSEELIIEFAKALAANTEHVVTVFHDQEKGIASLPTDLFLEPRDKFDVQNCDRVICWKERIVFSKKRDDQIFIKWTSDVECPYPIDKYDYVVQASQYHKNRHPWIPPDKSKIIPYGLPDSFLDLDTSKVTRKPNTMLYCSSPDRGLLDLLSDWNDIKKINPDLQLTITYGFENMLRFTNNAPQALHIVEGIRKFCNREDIDLKEDLPKDEMDKLYFSHKYWVHPLNNPDGELFCFNALKARRGGMVSVVNKYGALQNTVGDFIPYTEFIRGNEKILRTKAEVPIMNWQQVVNSFWRQMLEL